MGWSLTNTAGPVAPHCTVDLRPPMLSLPAIGIPKEVSLPGKRVFVGMRLNKDPVKSCQTAFNQHCGLKDSPEKGT